MTFYTEKNVSTLSWVLWNLLKSYQRQNTQLVGLKKKFASEQFSKVSTYFQFETSSQKNTERNNEASHDGTTTDKKRHISAEKLHNHQSHKTLSSTKATTTKKGPQFNQNKLGQVQVPQHHHDHYADANAKKAGLHKYHDSKHQSQCSLVKSEGGSRLHSSRSQAQV